MRLDVGGAVLSTEHLEDAKKDQILSAILLVLLDPNEQQGGSVEVGQMRTIFKRVNQRQAQISEMEELWREEIE